MKIIRYIYGILYIVCAGNSIIALFLWLYGKSERADFKTAFLTMVGLFVLHLFRKNFEEEEKPMMTMSEEMNKSYNKKYK